MAGDLEPLKDLMAAGYKRPLSISISANVCFMASSNNDQRRKLVAGTDDPFVIHEPVVLLGSGPGSGPVVVQVCVGRIKPLTQRHPAALSG